ncbi:MAG: D-amino acid aminotransferase, partial [SAR86 cluster bacterium]
MSDIVYVNGDYVPADQAKVSIFDRGFLFGDGIYEVIPVVNSHLVDKQYFLERLESSLGKMQLQWPCTPQQYI